MQVIFYGTAFAPLLDPIVGDIGAAASRLGHAVRRLPLEQALRQRSVCRGVERLYVLPFDLPADEARRAPAFLHHLFPHAEMINPPQAHELCWDKLTCSERLLARGIPVPESLYTSSASEVREFVAHHGFAILKERRSCGGNGHVILCRSDDGLVGEARGRRFAVELDEDPGARRRLRDRVFTCPAPFYLQRLIGSSDRRGGFVPGQVLRAYVVEGTIAFWTERYRDRYTRPSDWIVNVGLGAKYRFLQETSEECRKVVARTADVLGLRVGAVDLMRTGSSGPYVIEADCDGVHMYIDRQFKCIPEYRDAFNFDRFVAAALVGAEIPIRGVSHGS